LFDIYRKGGVKAGPIFSFISSCSSSFSSVCFSFFCFSSAFLYFVVVLQTVIAVILAPAVLSILTWDEFDP